MAPPSLASSSAGPSSAAGALVFEKRQGPAPEIPGVSRLVDKLNVVSRPHAEVIEDLHIGKRYFTELLDNRRQTKPEDGKITNALITPILRSENARNPGLNAIGCSDGNRMTDILKIISRSSQGQEGHVRFHLGVKNDNHRMAVDAFKHREGGFTLISVDSLLDHIFTFDLANLPEDHPNLIKGMMYIPTHNQKHDEGCRIFAVHTLNAMHDYQPHFQNLHREIYAAKDKKKEPQIPPQWDSWDGVRVLKNELDNFGLLPAKFFKHMQVKKPMAGETDTLLDQAEARYPALKNRQVNKKEQSLRQRIERQNSNVPLASFSRHDRTASLDQKRLALIERAIPHYKGLARAEGLRSNWRESVLGKRPWEAS
jgi:hypothetical protein